MPDRLQSLLAGLESSRLYWDLLLFYGCYPVLMAFVWMIQSTLFRFRQEKKTRPALEAPFPFVSILIPAYSEEAVIARTVQAALQIDYPEFEVIVINDGSPDGTAEAIRPLLEDERVRLLNKKVNEGKAMALNDAAVVARGEIFVVIDADIVVSPNILRALVPHFRSPRVAAVTGNPRVENRTKFLQHLQAIEFSSIISMQRRAQRVWGRVMTVSGAVFALRRSALADAGMFSPNMATEDIELTWRLQKRFWDVRYEPEAVVMMQAPPTLKELWKQRRRWARGLAQTLKKHCDVPFAWRLRRLWPVFYESCLSIAWSYTFVLLTSYWIICKFLGHEPAGASPIPNFWGMVIATVCIVQLTVGALSDRAYDKRILRSLPEIVWYPIVYWTLMASISSIYTIDALVRRPPRVQRWNIARGAIKDV